MQRVVVLRRSPGVTFPDLAAVDPSGGRAPRTKMTYVSDWLREQIVAGQLAPGTRLRQAEIAKHLGVSMTPVREAMLHLEMEGYLERIPHVGVNVVTIPRDRLEEVFPLRIRVEGFLVARAVEKATPEDIAALQELADALAEATERGDVVTQRTLNFRFHRRLWETARHPIGLDIANRLWAQFPADLFLHQEDRAARSVAEHSSILEAFEARDPDAAEEAMRAHIQSGLEDQARFRASLSEEAARASDKASG
jgi:DNA-binding GntR family transcriptional regulator